LSHNLCIVSLFCDKMACILNINHNAEEDDSSIDWQLPISFVKKLHTEKIEGACAITQTWRMKERVRVFKCCVINSSEPVEWYYLLCCWLLWFVVHHPVYHIILQWHCNSTILWPVICVSWFRYCLGKRN